MWWIPLAVGAATQLITAASQKNPDIQARKNRSLLEIEKKYSKAISEVRETAGNLFNNTIAKATEVSGKAGQVAGVDGTGRMVADSYITAANQRDANISESTKGLQYAKAQQTDAIINNADAQEADWEMKKPNFLTFATSFLNTAPELLKAGVGLQSLLKGGDVLSTMKTDTGVGSGINVGTPIKAKGLGQVPLEGFSKARGNSFYQNQIRNWKMFGGIK